MLTAAGVSWRDVLARRGIEASDADHAAIIGRAWPHGFEHFSARGDLGGIDRFRAELRDHAAAAYAESSSCSPTRCGPCSR